MRKRKHSYKELSNITCSVTNCKKKIKKNVAERFPHKKDLKCYRHFKDER